jgi:hypothetical protein
VSHQFRLECHRLASPEIGYERNKENEEMGKRIWEKEEEERVRKGIEKWKTGGREMKIRKYIPRRISTDSLYTVSVVFLKKLGSGTPFRLASF